MNKLVIKKIEFRNFLSFGNTWQTLNIVDGVTLVRGVDHTTKKSNGSGKSSLMELLPVALFGQTIKDVKKDKIPNWHNKTKCEIKLNFSINDDNYMFYRCIKPNKFIVYKNDEIIPQLSNVRDFQIKINEDIIGMDFKTFSNLVYFSPNTTISIVSAKKEQKRKFLESLFDLSEYSNMLRLCNPKLTKQRSNISLYENNMDNISSKIELLMDDIHKSIIPDTKPLVKDINFNKLRLEGLMDKDIQFDENKHKGLLTRIDGLEQDLVAYVSGIEKTDIQLEYTNKTIQSIDIDGVTEQHSKIDIQISDIKEKINSIDVVNINNKLSYIKEKIGINTKEIDEQQSKIDNYTKLRYRLSSDNEHNEGLISEIDEKDTLDGVDECPLCIQKVDHSKIKDYYSDKRVTLLDKCGSIKESIIQIDKYLDGAISDIEILNKDTVFHNNEYDGLNKQISDIEILKDKLTVIQDHKQNLSDIKDIQKTFDNEVQIRDNLVLELNTSVFKRDMIETDLDLAKTSFKVIDEQRQQKEIIDSDIDTIKNEIKSLEDRVNDLNILVVKESKRISDKKVMIKELEFELSGISNDISRSNVLIDYFEYIKLSLKDENIKQYTISSLLPFLNRQTNYYLSESGFPYKVEIDGWLDVTIKGFGVNDVGYSSLSGGERKSIDISIQFACNDISALQASSMINLSIYDEILDTSLDEQSLIPLLDIIKVKQRDTGSSVYLITHKSELNDLDFDNYISIEKKDGFSHINEDV